MRLPSPIQPEQVIDLVGGQLHGNTEITLQGINELHKVIEGDITFVDHPKYYKRVLESAATFIIIDKVSDFDTVNKCILVHPEPFVAYNQLVDHFYQFEAATKAISDSAEIGKGSVIQPNSFIGNKVRIGKNCLIHSNVSIYDNVIIGDNVIVQANTTIGSDAFYFKKIEGAYHKLKSCGNVVIGDNVEIGAGCTIDKGVSGDTIIGAGTKLDNQIHIAHGAVIGKNCLFAAQTTVAGKTIIEDDVILWGQVGVNKSIRVGKGAVVMAQSGVTNSIEGNKTYFGMPAQEAYKQMRQQAVLRQLPDLVKDLKKK